ncbi:MAG TPA: phosphate ABC transporter substrate-binding protein [Candidatus Eisenbacteria bacterium]|nr:phosphate ABC transporter substrate-binding protein [Candidatus Eisenbacteria bacterium]
MSAKNRVLLSAFALLACLSCAPAFAKEGASIQIKGSDTMVNLVQAWAETYMGKNPDVFIAVTGGGSGTGFAALINGTCDLAAASREIKPAEVAAAGKKGIQPKEFKVALDGLAVAVHPSNAVSTLTLDQLAGIFSGKITNWKDVGGKDLKIVVLSREVNSGTHVYFKEHVLRHGDAASKEEFSPEALMMPSSQAIVDEISQNPAAVGYFGMGYLSGSMKTIAVASSAGEPVTPSLDSVVSGRYPISRPLYIYSKGEPADAVKGFMDFVLSKEGQDVVSQNDFVPAS